MMISLNQTIRYNNKLISRNGYINIFKLCALAPFTTIKSLLMLTFSPFRFNSNSKSLNSAARSKSNAFALPSFLLLSSQLSFHALFRHLLSVASYVSGSSAAVVARIHHAHLLNRFRRNTMLFIVSFLYRTTTLRFFNCNAHRSRYAICVHNNAAVFITRGTTNCLN